MTSSSDGHDAAALRRALAQLEAKAAAAGWVWDARLSLRVDALRVQLEGEHP